MRTRVHLLKSEEVDKAAYHEIVQQLQSFSGPLEFVSTVDEPVFEDDENLTVQTDNKKLRDKSLPLPKDMLQEYAEYSFSEKRVFSQAQFDEKPEKLMRLKWDDIFEQ